MSDSTHSCSFWRTPGGTLECGCGKSKRPIETTEEVLMAEATYERDTPLSPEEFAVVERFGLAASYHLPDDLRAELHDALEDVDEVRVDDVLDALTPILAAHFERQGAEAMRDRAADAADRIKGSHYPYSMGWAAGERASAAIRALPPQPTTGTEEANND